MRARCPTVAPRRGGYAGRVRPFKASEQYAPMGDQPRAIGEIAESVAAGNRFQTILGATGTGKTATMAWTIEKLQRPALVIAHNKTLAAQLCNEFREFFPDNAVEYFVSYYDYFQPEAYIPQADLYIEKDSSRNDDIARLRLSATSSLLTRRDVVVVASVSCIYGLGSPEEWRERVLMLEVGETHDRDEVLRKLIESQYVRNDTVLGRGRFRVKGDLVEIQPANIETAYRVSFFGDEVEQITHFDSLTGEVYSHLDNLVIWPATEYVTSSPTIERAIDDLRAELEQQVAKFEAEGRMLEAHRIRQRTEYDLEMMKELGFCNGIENYSRALEGRPVGSHPFTLIDYFPDDFVCFVDESHQTIPQLGGMYEGDRSRKQTLIDFGFRLPSALDNRPLRFDEFLGKVQQLVFVSATPGPFELSRSKVIAEQLIRPTGVVDPEMELRPTKNQIDDLLNEIRHREEAGERVLVTTLTKKMSEDLTDYLLEAGVRARYLHSEIDTLDRIAIIRELRLGEYDVLVGVNLLREGLDLPEVSLVAVLDADKEGFLRGKTALIQTTGPRRAQHGGEGHPVRGQAHRGDRRRDGGDVAPSRGPGRLQRGARDHARVDREGRLRHLGAPLARVAARSLLAPPSRKGRGRGDVARGAREARHHARGGDVPRRRGAPLRVRRQAARRDQGASPRADRLRVRVDAPTDVRAIVAVERRRPARLGWTRGHAAPRGRRLVRRRDSRAGRLLPPAAVCDRIPSRGVPRCDGRGRRRIARSFACGPADAHGAAARLRLSRSRSLSSCGRGAGVRHPRSVARAGRPVCPSRSRGARPRHACSRHAPVPARRRGRRPAELARHAALPPPTCGVVEAAARGSLRARTLRTCASMHPRRTRRSRSPRR